MLTHEAGNEHPGDPLLPHLLDLGLVTRRNGSTHYCQRVDVSDRADGGSCEPGQAEQATEATQRANQKQVKMEAGALEEPPRLLADNEPVGGLKEKELAGRQTCNAHSLGLEGRGGLKTTALPGPVGFLFTFPN